MRWADVREWRLGECFKVVAAGRDRRVAVLL